MNKDSLFIRCSIDKMFIMAVIIFMLSSCQTMRGQYGMHDSEKLVSITNKEFPSIDRTAKIIKILDTTTGNIRQIVVDGYSHKPVDLSNLYKENEAKWRNDHGAISISLQHDLQKMNQQVPMTTNIWVDVPPSEPFQTNATTPTQWDADHSAYLQHMINTNRASVKAARDLIEAAGASIYSVEFEPPRIIVNTTRKNLEEKIAFIPQIKLIHADDSNQQLLAVNAAKNLVQAPLGLAHALGNGKNLRIAIVETGACIRSNHPHFQIVTFENSLGLPGRCDPPSGHATWVAGAVAGVVGNPGAFEFVGLFGGRLFEASVPFLSTDLLARNPHFINRSQLIGEPSQNSYDRFIFMHRIFIANGSGNKEDEVVSCYSFNTLCVGGFVDNQTIGKGNFDDDVNAGASWMNDPTTGREEPDVVGDVAQTVPDSVGFNSPYTQVGGTSFATPNVVGLTALLTASFPEPLLGNPTLARAVLMASARPVKGFEGETATIPIVADGIDDRSGAGAPRGDVGKDILNDDQYFSGFFDRAIDFDANGMFQEKLGVVASPGQKIRVVLNWDQCPAMAPSDRSLMIDLDMTIRGPSLPEEDPLVFSNVSAVDNYEIVEFVVPRQGEYAINIQAQSWEVCPINNSQSTHIAVVWTRS